MTSSPQRPSGPASPGQAGPPAVPEQRAAPDGATAAPVGARRRWSTARAVLAVLGGMAVLLCLGGLGIGYLLYDEATAPDRSGPEVAADSYLRALLVERNDARANVFACTEQAGLASLQDFRRDVEAREASLGTAITINLEDMRIQHKDEATASVEVGIRRSAAVDGGRQSIPDRWVINLRNDNGWRVCAAEKVS